MAVPISNVVRRIVFAPSGVGPYAFTFEILAATDIEVYKGDTLLTLTTDYTVTINVNGTGSVTLVVTAGTDNITIVGARTIQRTTDFVTGGDLFANSLNEELDSLTIFTQQNAEAADRSIRAPVTDPTTIDMTLPVKADRAGKYLSFNSSTGDPEVVNNVVDITAVANNATNINLVAGQISPSNNISTVAGAAANIATVAGIAANVTTVAGISGNVTTVAGISADVTTVAADGTDIGTVAGLSTEIAALGPIAADITTVAGIDSDVTAVAADATDIGTVATNIANVNTVAGISANVTTVAGDSADIQTVAGIDSDITTVAGIAANVTTVAGISANVTTVAGISADVTTVATNVADITNFSDVYLGPAATDPATRNDSSALQAGDLYFNTADDAIKVYTGSAWVTAYITADGFVTVGDAQTITGVKTFDNGLATDTISEETSAAGVTVDGVLLKDSGVVTGAGTVSAPVYSTTGDTNTGIFFPAADTIGLAAGGVEVARVVSGLMTIPANSTAASAVRLFEDTDNGTNYVDIIAPSAITSDRTLTIPDASGTIDRLNRAGNVLQVVNATKTNSSSTSSTSYTDTGLTATITPVATANKILVAICVPIVGLDNTGNIGYVQLQRNGTSIIETTGGGLGETNDATFTVGGMQFASNERQSDSVNITYLDSPSTTSAVTYKLQMKMQSGGGTMYFNTWATDSNKTSVATITLMEIAG